MNSKYVANVGDGATLTSENYDKGENNEEMKLALHVGGEYLHWLLSPATSQSVGESLFLDTLLVKAEAVLWGGMCFVTLSVKSTQMWHLISAVSVS